MGSTDLRYFVEDATAEREAKTGSKEIVCSVFEGKGAFGVGKGDDGRHLGER